MCMLYMVIESKNLPCQGMHATPLFPWYILGLLLKYHGRKPPCLIPLYLVEQHQFSHGHCQQIFQQLLQFSVNKKMLSRAAEMKYILRMVHDNILLL
jgi:hypothetical protein